MADAQNGLIVPGNIDLNNRPQVKNRDGSVSTVRSISVNIDGKEVLIPTVVNGRVVSNDDAVRHYMQTGQHLGIFDNPEHATQYAKQLHETEQSKLMADQQEVVIVDRNGTEHHFPAGFDPQKATQIVRQQMLRSGGAPSSKGGLVMAGAKAAIPVAQEGFEQFATSPTAWRTAKDVGQAVGGLGGLLKGGPVGAAAGIYAGGKVGYRLSNAAQRVAAPIAQTLEHAAPYAQTLGTLSGVQGGLDLAQMADPQRRDIGFLGIGLTPQEIPPQQSLIDALRSSNPYVKALIDRIVGQVGQP